jgi:parvulin-like peptidyl-prolyl isomerase
MANQQQIKKTKTKKHLAREQREAKQTRVIMIITIVIGVLILGLVAYGLIDQLIVKPRAPIAKVGDTIIRAKEFKSRVQYERVQALNQTYEYYNYSLQLGEYGQSFLQYAQQIANQLALHENFGEDVLEGMIQDIIIREEAEKRGITVSDAELEDAFQAAFGYFPDGTPTPIPTGTIAATPTYSETQLALFPPTLTPTEADTSSEDTEATPTPTEVAEEDNGESKVDDIVIPSPTPEVSPTITPTSTITPTRTITPTPTQYTSKLFRENQNQFDDLYSLYNFSLDDFREVIEISLLSEKLLAEVTEDLVPVKDEVWARHILVETEEEALEVLERLDAGDDFAALAAEYSTDDSNSNSGGDLGWFDENTMVPEFSEAAFGLEIGEISEPIETSYGFHIIQSLGQREIQMPESEFAQEKQIAFSEWLEEQRNGREDIAYYVGWEKHIPETPVIPQDFLFALFQIEE